jgi:hypothetical protein
MRAARRIAFSSTVPSVVQTTRSARSGCGNKIVGVTIFIDSPQFMKVSFSLSGGPGLQTTATAAGERAPSNAPRMLNIPRAVSGDEFLKNYGPEDKPIAIAPPCKDNKQSCDPADRLWNYFPGDVEPGAIVTPNGLIYRGKK